MIILEHPPQLALITLRNRPSTTADIWQYKSTEVEDLCNDIKEQQVMRNEQLVFPFYIPLRHHKNLHDRICKSGVS
ncbi:hypothetical protein CEXT_173941 [Caerostris extrusa]|uniref:Uncharacterized protein n=1 Tax=Caerostris extrusa TaxID=172846 RepID=A0AAV4TX40_CAEEX|nr:hypothetical protein CEXT_173941 [Caerostris extrusa]